MKRTLVISLVLLNSLLAVVVAAEINGESLTQFVHRVNADAQNNGEAGRICMLKGVAAVGSKVMYQRQNGNGQMDCNGYRHADCSGYVLGVAEPIFQLPDQKVRRLSASDIHDLLRRYGGAQDLGFSAGSYEPEPGDIVFFHPHGGTGVSHIGIYLGRGYFVHSSGADGTLLHITALDEHANAKGSSDVYTWRNDLVGYGDVSRLPLRPEAERQRMIAESGGSREVTAGPGGVYISPALILDAIASDSTGALDALDDAISKIDFSESPVQVLPDDLQPPAGFNNDDDRAGAAQSRLEGSAAFRELLKSVPD